MRITQKVIKILALMEKSGPKYGRQLVELAPDLFIDSPRSGEARGAPLSNVYVMLRRMEQAKLIEWMENFHPDVADGSPQAGARKWYSLTAAGRDVLSDARAALEVE